MSMTGRIGLWFAGLAALALCCLGCVTAAERLQRWEGRPVADLVADRGPADRIVQYPYGGRLYIWEEERDSATSADATGRRTAVGQRNETRVYREIALVGDDGLIVRTQVQNGIKGSTPSF
jgi:hypothetical protein